MTGIRTSAVWKPEPTFGTQSKGNWYRFPAGLTFSYDPSNNPTYTTSIGSKFYDLVTAGRFSGTWTAEFKLDYENIAILGAMFEDYSYSNGTHKFSKKNGKRVPSMNIGIKKLNRVVNEFPTQDQNVILVGCVCTGFNFNQSSNSATMDCSMNGLYVNEISTYDNLATTDYDSYYGSSVTPVEWSCMQIDGKAVAYTESAGINVTNGVSSVPGCGTRFDKGYIEGKTTVSVRTTVYSNNPQNYYQRMYSGGAVNQGLKGPKERGLKPIKSMELVSKDGSRSCTFKMKDVFVEKAGQSRFGDSKIVDSPGLKASECSIEIVNSGVGKITVWDSTTASVLTETSTMAIKGLAEEKPVQETSEEPVKE